MECGGIQHMCHCVWLSLSVSLLTPSVGRKVENASGFLVVSGRSTRAAVQNCCCDVHTEQALNKSSIIVQGQCHSRESLDLVGQCKYNCWRQVMRQRVTIPSVINKLCNLYCGVPNQCAGELNISGRVNRVHMESVSYTFLSMSGQVLRWYWQWMAFYDCTIQPSNVLSLFIYDESCWFLKLSDTFKCGVMIGGAFFVVPAIQILPR